VIGAGASEAIRSTNVVRTESSSDDYAKVLTPLRISRFVRRLCRRIGYSNRGRVPDDRHIPNRFGANRRDRMLPPEQDSAMMRAESL
jgi:hypothetical protein